MSFHILVHTKPIRWSPEHDITDIFATNFCVSEPEKRFMLAASALDRAIQRLIKTIVFEHWLETIILIYFIEFIDDLLLKLLWWMKYSFCLSPFPYQIYVSLQSLLCLCLNFLIIISTIFTLSFCIRFCLYLRNDLHDKKHTYQVLRVNFEFLALNVVKILSKIFWVCVSLEWTQKSNISEWLLLIYIRFFKESDDIISECLILIIKKLILSFFQ